MADGSRTNLNCGQTRRQLQRWFDEGLETTEDLDVHLAVCPLCSGYAAELAELAQALHSIPLEQPDPLLMSRIQREIAAARPAAAKNYWVHGLAAGFLAAIIAGWLYPIALDTNGLWSLAGRWMSPPDWAAWQSAFAFDPAALLDQAREQTQALAATTGISMPTPIAGVAVAGAAIFLITFNSVEALALRARGKGSNRGT